jgi:cyclomaltodextrinase / maltogenic alpha-amylase / neopullulanase
LKNPNKFRIITGKPVFRAYIKDMHLKSLLFAAAVLFHQSLLSASIVLYKTDATVWLPQQTIRGNLTGFFSSTITVHQNDSSFQVNVNTNGSFSFQIKLLNDTNRIHVTSGNISSPVVNLILAYHPFPIIQPVASVNGSKVHLSSKIIDDRLQQQITYKWKSSPFNPAHTEITTNNNATADVIIPHKPGEYYFTLYATAAKRTDSFSTLVTRTKKDLKAFNIEADKANWINKAIVYQITPYIFVQSGKYADIEDKLPELVELGINTIYLQPVFKNEHGGQGYDITDYFSLRRDLGTEEQLHSLIRKAKSYNLRVLFDMVPNHTSIHHPYAIDKIFNGDRSHYSDYYQQKKDNALYSQHYHEHEHGFIYYFWPELVNLNYDNEEVQRWMIEACKHWIRKYGIDGYRFDAVWGTNARTPSFAKRLQLELKCMKPDVLLLAEDKAAAGYPYKLGFDAAYDWDKSLEWISKWSWQYEYDEEHRNTIFNHPSIAERKQLMQRALFSDGDSIGLRFRFLENNDMHRFITNHSRDVTEMAATLLFTLPGIPMIYNGQETGFRVFPYRSAPIFERAKKIRTGDPVLFNFYKSLANIRSKNDALTSTYMREIPVTGAGGIIAFHRKSDSQDIIVVMNMSPNINNPLLQIENSIPLQGGGLSFTDLVSGDTIIAKAKGSGAITVAVTANTTRVLLLNKNVKVPSDEQRVLSVSPNPTRGDFILHYEMQDAGDLNISVCDTGGRVIEQHRRQLPAGPVSFPMNILYKTAGTCFLTADDGKRKYTTQVMLLDN